jgi:hypothetical protein
MIRSTGENRYVVTMGPFAALVVLLIALLALLGGVVYGVLTIEDGSLILWAGFIVLIPLFLAMVGWMSWILWTWRRWLIVEVTPDGLEFRRRHGGERTKIQSKDVGRVLMENLWGGIASIQVLDPSGNEVVKMRTGWLCVSEFGLMYALRRNRYPHAFINYPRWPGEHWVYPKRPKDD